jgi:hypothetical protein
MKTFTLEEAQSLLPVMESLLKRAIEGKQSAVEVESGLTDLARRIYLSGGMKVDTGKVAKLRADLEGHVQRVRESVAEIDAVGVQVKDLDAGLLDFPCRLAKRPSSTGTLSTPASKTASRWMNASTAAPLRATGPTEKQGIGNREQGIGPFI